MAGPRTPLRLRAVDVRVDSLPTRVDAAAASLLTEQFLEDPIWRAIGPVSPTRRRKVLLCFHRGELANARRWGGVVLGAHTPTHLLGVQVAYPPGAFPLPKRALGSAVPSMLLAGPGPALRALAVNQALERLHPRFRTSTRACWRLIRDGRASGAFSRELSSSSPNATVCRCMERRCARRTSGSCAHSASRCARSSRSCAELRGGRSPGRRRGRPRPSAPSPLRRRPRTRRCAAPRPRLRPPRG
jgi:hypothetical protein